MVLDSSIICKNQAFAMLPVYESACLLRIHPLMTVLRYDNQSSTRLFLAAFSLVLAPALARESTPVEAILCAQNM